MKIKEWFSGLKLNHKFTTSLGILVMVPIICLSFVLLMFFKRSVVNDNISQMEYNMERSQEELESNLKAVNMVTQFFLKDEGLHMFLEKAYDGEDFTIDEIRSFKETDVAALERLVNNNASLYGVRTYGSNDYVQEMMPVLYQHSRMMKQVWAQDPEGWKIGYSDQIFDSGTVGGGQLIGLITPVYNRDQQKIGTIEAAMTMADMFPEIYDTMDEGWGCLIEKDGTMHFDGEPDENWEKIAGEISGEYGNDKTAVTFSKKCQGRNIVAAHIYVSKLDSELILVKDITDNLATLNGIGSIFVILLVVMAVLMAILINHLVQRILQRFYLILAETHEVQDGNLDIHFEDDGLDEMSELGGQMNKMMDQIKELMNEGIQREILVKNSEIKALQNQINAHFIYNVLESIKMMAEIDERYDISDSITALGELLRYGMKWTKSNVTVEQEIDYIRNYIQLMNLRYDFKIHLSVNMPREIYSQQIPKMSLQPIIENAICHGIEELSEDATIYIKALMAENDYIIEITDSGSGMDEEHVQLLMHKIKGEIEVSGGSGNGIGLKNVQDRIQLNFGEEYGITVASKAGCYTKISVHLPMTEKKAWDGKEL
ncbi:MAG: sensor histidine kinase [Lachnospiraceae bacterium]|nr:sensor histidine kinase [Lachnospiraceae bacterium]